MSSVPRPMLVAVPVILALVALILLAGYVTGTPAILDRGTDTLRIATTTSLDDSGLLEEILPDFEEQYDVETDVIAVGTGQALVLGERGDVDLVLVHAPGLEQEFVDQGYGVDRTTVMRNPFILVGPEGDPAGISDASDAADAFMRIADSEATFVSRGDDSGTHTKELAIWDAAGFEPDSELDWYHSAGQGMGETLLTAHEFVAYTLTDRATFLAMGDQMSDLEPHFGAPGQVGKGDELLDNPYSAIAVNPEQHPNTNSDMAAAFSEWFDSESTREQIAGYGIDVYGEPLFTLIE